MHLLNEYFPEIEAQKYSFAANYKAKYGVF